MNREGRLASAASSWLKTYNGKRRIYGYRKHFGVDAGTAIAELRLLGVPLAEEEIRKARQGERAVATAKQARKEKRLRRQREQKEVETPWSDGTYAYIAGYTDWGFPYGITWEEMGRYADQESLDRTVPPRSRNRRQFTADEAEVPLVQAREEQEVLFDLELFMRDYEDVRNETTFYVQTDTAPVGFAFDPDYAYDKEE